MDELMQVMARGGVVIWIIAALSVATLALAMWKLWWLLRAGAWSGARTETALALWARGDAAEAEAILSMRRGLRARLAQSAMAAARALPEAEAREETLRVARGLMAETRAGLRALELSAAIAPLLGLLGTVIGMIAAFQALQAAGARADPATLAGGIWEALLTTAAGMGVAILASLALSWFESVADQLAHDLEDIATRVFLARPPAPEDRG
ncbi:flagellar motor protein MotA [Rhodobacteraceae bacterium WD3A24]|nr:flagellar motor protein MotA [Rhodobacteraceae bacterium WD3A24]